MSKARSPHAVLAALLLLLSALLPGLHTLAHAIVEAQEAAMVCADCGGGVDAGSASVRGGSEAPKSGHRHGSDGACGLCLIVANGRDVLLPPAFACARPSPPPAGLWMPACPIGAESERALRPPARAPPLA